MTIFNMSRIPLVFKAGMTAFTAEYLSEQPNNNLICINLDTGYNLYGEYSKLNVDNTFIKDGRISFKSLMHFIQSNKESNIVVDVGASAFMPLINYIIKNNIISEFKQQNIKLLFMSPVEENNYTRQSIKDFYILSNIPNINLIVIYNEMMRGLDLPEKDFLETKAYLQAVKTNVIFGEIYLQKLSSPIKNTIIKMFHMGILFGQIEEGKDFDLLQVRHIKGMKAKMWSNFEQAFSDNINKKITLGEARGEATESSRAFADWRLDKNGGRFTLFP